jgi:hypothetical protein
VSVFELRHYGALIEGAGADIARRLSAFEAEQEESAARHHHGGEPRAL